MNCWRRRRTGLGLTASVLAMAACASRDTPAPGPDAKGGTGSSKPNIIILFADDLGYGGLGVQGDKEARTPHIDALAAAGARLTDYYSNHPVCSPSRAALMTGVYQHRMGFEFNSGSPANTSDKFGIAADQPTLPERLKTAGYATGMFGKWHVGFRPETVPTARGFDEFYGFLAGAHSYTPEALSQRAAAGGSVEGTQSRILRGTKPEAMPAHLTETLADETVRFIRANKDKPFFAYVPFNAVHSPLDATAAYEAQFAHIADRTRRVHLAQLAAMDDAVGKVVAEVRALGLEDQTLIVFTSDNGGPTQQTTSSNGPLNGVKGLVLEGGIRVPAIIQWKGKIPAGRTVDTPAIGFDITATSLAAAGVLAPGLDGVDLMPWLKGEASGDAHEALFWRSGGQGAVRSGDWKLIKNGETYHLFDLATDVGERKDLATQEPQKLAALKAQWMTWSSQMKDPLWVRNDKRESDPKSAWSRSRSMPAIEQFIRGEAAQVTAAD